MPDSQSLADRRMAFKVILTGIVILIALPIVCDLDLAETLWVWAVLLWWLGMAGGAWRGR